VWESGNPLFTFASGSGEGHDDFPTFARGGGGGGGGERED